MAGPPVAGGGDRHRTVDRRHHGADQRVERPLLQCAAGSKLERLRLPARLFLRAGDDLHSARGLSALSQSMAADPLAALADLALPRSLDGGRQSLPHAAHGRRRRQSGPAHLRGHRAVHPIDLGHRPATAQFLRHAVLVHGHPVVAVGGGAAARVRAGLRYSGLPVMGGADLCLHRHRTHASDRPPADRAQLPTAALRSRFPIQSGAGARELRADRPARRRARRARPPADAVRQCGGELARDHDAAEKAHLLHRQLCAGIRRFPVRHGEPGLFRQRHPARRPDADRQRLRAGAGARSRCS